MNNIKTYEGFFDFFSKKSNDKQKTADKVVKERDIKTFEKFNKLPDFEFEGNIKKISFKNCVL